MRINEGNFDILDKASNITGTDYNIRWFDAENISGYIDDDDLVSMIEDLVCEIDRLEEKIEDMEQDIKDNYRRIPIAEQVGVSDRDFI